LQSKKKYVRIMHKINAGKETLVREGNRKAASSTESAAGGN